MKHCGAFRWVGSEAIRRKPHFSLFVLKWVLALLYKDTKVKDQVFARSFTLVRLCDLSWKQIVPSLRLIQSKLIDLGFWYSNGNVVINETETDESQYHT